METVKSPAEHRIILHNTSWETYERLLEEREDSRVPRLAYDRGELEIMSPSSEHERVGYGSGRGNMPDRQAEQTFLWIRDCRHAKSL
jgi:Uma2 family endonuclease